MLFILSRDFEVMVSANNMGEAMPYFDDIHKQNIEAGTGSYEFKIPTNHPNAKYVQEGNYVVRTDLDGNYLMFTIMSLEESHEGDSLKTVYCEDAGLELLNEISLPYKETTTKDIKHYINKAINGTGWVIGYCDVKNVRTLEFTDYENVLARILRIASLFDGAEISFSVELVGSKVKRRMVNIHKKRGIDTGKRFVYSKDITSIKRSVDMTEVATSLLGVGKTDEKDNKTTFRSNTYDDGDIYTKSGSEYIYSRTALERWGQVAGHIHRIFQYETSSSSELLNRSISDLKKRQNPSVTYDVSVALLERIAGLEGEKIRIGDTVKIVDTTFTPELYLEARIMALEISYNDPSKDRVVLGNYRVVESNIAQEIRNIQNRLMEREATWEQIGETIYKDMLAPQNPEINDLWLDTTSEPNQLKRWDGTKWVLAGVYNPDDLGVYDKEEIDKKIEFAEWYAGVKAGTNLINNIFDYPLPDGYEWIEEVTPDGTIGKVLKKVHVGGQLVNNNKFSIASIPVDPTKTYFIEFYVQAKDSNSRYYYGLEEYTEEGLENDSGNRPYPVNNVTPKSEDIGRWKKHFALIPPHFAGLENDHLTEQSPYTPDEEFKFWSVSTAQVEIETYLTYSPLNETLDSEMWATGFALYEVGTSDALYNEINDVSDKVGEIDNRTNDISIINTVIASPDFDSIMSDKANAEDLTGLISEEQLTGVKTGLEGYIDGRIDGEGGVNEAINKVSSDLEKTANSITAKFTSSGGINKILNSLGFAGLDFFTVTDGEMDTLQNRELELLGFGSGFYSPQGSNDVIEQVVNTARDKDFSLSFWIKKNADNGVNANAGVEIWANNELVAFVGKLTGEVTEDYELGTYTFSTEYSEITIKVVSGEGAESTISGLMLNAGTQALQWQHHPSEIYNTNIQMNLNGIKVLSGDGKNYTIMSKDEFSGYYETLDENNQPQMERVFTLNNDTTEVTKLDVDDEITLNPIKLVPIESTLYNGLAFVSTE